MTQSDHGEQFPTRTMKNWCTLTEDILDRSRSKALFKVYKGIFESLTVVLTQAARTKMTLRAAYWRSHPLLQIPNVASHILEFCYGDLAQCSLLVDTQPEILSKLCTMDYWIRTVRWYLTRDRSLQDYLTVRRDRLASIRRTLVQMYHHGLGMPNSLYQWRFCRSNYSYWFHHRDNGWQEVFPDIDWQLTPTGPIEIQDRD